MSDAYTEIMALRGMEEFKALARRLKLLGENRRRLKLENVLIPHYLFTEAAGSGAKERWSRFSSTARLRSLDICTTSAPRPGC